MDLDILERIDEKLDTGTLKSINKDVEAIMFLIRDRAADRLLKHMRKGGEYTPTIKKLHSSLKRVQAELADFSSELRSRM